MKNPCGNIAVGTCLLSFLALTACEQKKKPADASLSPVAAFEARLQSAFGQYHPAALGTQEWHFVELNRSAEPLLINGTRYDGIKFTYPGPAGSDFVWAFQAPGADSSQPYFDNWFIASKDGLMSGGFKTENWRIRKFARAPQPGEMLHIQAIDGDRFRTGESYFIYFTFAHDQPVRLAYRLAFKPLRTDPQGHFLLEDMAGALQIDLTESEPVR